MLKNCTNWQDNLPSSGRSVGGGGGGGGFEHTIL